MALEIEKKYRIDQAKKETLLKKLEAFGVMGSGQVFEENIIFSNDILKEKQAILRVRKVGGRSILTYKRAINNIGDIKKQIEFETAVENASEILAILYELDLVPATIYEKKREIFHFHAVEIAFDELPFGDFMEIEGSEDGIREVESLLEIDDFEAVRETYPHLTVRYGKMENGIIIARF